MDNVGNNIHPIGFLTHAHGQGRVPRWTPHTSGRHSINGERTAGVVQFLFKLSLSNVSGMPLKSNLFCWFSSFFSQELFLSLPFPKPYKSLSM